MEEYPGMSLGELLNLRPGSGDVKSAILDMRNLGKIVARILADERTVNQTVFTAEGEATLNEIWTLASRFTEDPEAFLKKQVKVNIM
jgi:hypothetical protein